jgi:hypothetical protein
MNGTEDEQKKRNFGSISDAANGKLDDKEEKRDSLSLLSKNMTLPVLSTHPTTMDKGECSVPVVVVPVLLLMHAYVILDR